MKELHLPLIDALDLRADEFKYPKVPFSKRAISAYERLHRAADHAWDHPDLEEKLLKRKSAVGRGIVRRELMKLGLPSRA
ncbi:MAG: hypothetical protein RLZZ283_415 [Candidatus Parcubacteria bacterium]